MTSPENVLEWPVTAPRRHGRPQNQAQGVVRKKGLEPLRGYPLEPKSSASTNSATFASFAGLQAADFQRLSWMNPRPSNTYPTATWAMVALRQSDAFYGSYTAQHKRAGDANGLLMQRKTTYRMDPRCYRDDSLQF
jgi:hypothetical protein